MKLFLILFAITFIGCKKQKFPIEPMPIAPSERYVFLTHNKWKWTHEYLDSTTYAKSHVNDWPLNTTEDLMSIYDTCSWDSESTFRTDGKWEVLKSKTCDSSISPNAGSWMLINDDRDFVIVGQDTMHIVELTRRNLKM